MSEFIEIEQELFVVTRVVCQYLLLAQLGKVTRDLTKNTYMCLIT